MNWGIESEALPTGEVRLSLLGQKVRLLPERALFWEEESLLVVSDAHFGKISALRADGIALPHGTAEADSEKLRQLLGDCRPRECLFLGDLFHNRQNGEWREVEAIFREFPHIRFSLVEGNHDILAPEVYQEAGLFLYGESVTCGPFVFSHDRVYSGGGYNIHGHLHPGIRLKGKGGESLRRPAFLFATDRAVLPAFGEFTGTMLLPEASTMQAFVIGEESVFEVQTRERKFSSA